MTTHNPWLNKIKDSDLALDLQQLPTYGWQYFFKNPGRFKSIFFILTLVGALSNIARFTTVLILSKLISSVTELSLDTILYFYIPLWAIAITLVEVFDFLTRRFSEALPQAYTEIQILRFYRALLQTRFQALQNMSKERLITLIQRYLAGVQGFLSDWVWTGIARLVRFLIVLGILAYQSPVILALALIYITFFLSIALKISARFSQFARSYSEQMVQSGMLTNSLILNLNFVRKLALVNFFTKTWQELISQNLTRLNAVRKFHSKRWFLQMNLFNALYLGTLILTIVNIKNGTVALGYLILIKWAFDELWSSLVYVVEYYVSLVQQKEDWLVVKQELAPLLAASSAIKQTSGARDQQGSLETSDLKYTNLKESTKLNILGHSNFKNWQKLSLKNAHAQFKVFRDDPSNSELDVSISVPEFTLEPGSKVAIIGKSGTGKTTILNMLLNLCEYSGDYFLDRTSIKSQDLPSNFISILGSNDPLFQISLHDNIVLGRAHEPSKLAELLKGLQIDWGISLDQKIGTVDTNLSTGQEQRLRLARTLLQASEIYLLDEPFAGLDSQTKQKIITFLKVYLKDKTVVLVTHNEAELELVDDVYTFRGSVLVKNSSLMQN